MPTPIKVSGPANANASPTTTRNNENGRTSASGDIKLKDHLNALPESTDQATAQHLPSLPNIFSVSESVASQTCHNGVADPSQSNMTAENYGDSVTSNGSKHPSENGSPGKEIDPSTPNKQGRQMESTDAVDQNEQEQSTDKSVLNMTTVPLSTDANAASDGANLCLGTESTKPNETDNNTIATNQSTSEAATKADVGLLSRIAQEKKLDDDASTQNLEPKKKRVRPSSVTCLETASDIASEAKKRDRTKRHRSAIKDFPTDNDDRKPKVEDAQRIDAPTKQIPRKARSKGDKIGSLRGSNVTYLESESERSQSDIASEAKKHDRKKPPPTAAKESQTNDDLATMTEPIPLKDKQSKSREKVQTTEPNDVASKPKKRDHRKQHPNATKELDTNDDSSKPKAEAVMRTAMMTEPIPQKIQLSSNDKKVLTEHYKPAHVAAGESEKSGSQDVLLSIQSHPEATSEPNTKQNTGATIELSPSQGDDSRRRSTRPRKPIQDVSYMFDDEDEIERPLKRTKKSESKSESQWPSRAMKKSATTSLDIHENSEAPQQNARNKSDVIFETLKLDKKILSKLTKQSSSQHYHEESSYRYHNPPFTGGFDQLALVRSKSIPGTLQPVRPADLKPLPPSADLPALPTTGYCAWSFNVDSRVLLANFRANASGGKVSVTFEDEEFLLKMMERDDITVISEGLVDEFDSSLLGRGYVEGSIGPEFHHKVKEFKKTPVMPRGRVLTGEVNAQFEEKGWYSMKVSDYFAYLDQRQKYQNFKTNENDDADDGGAADTNKLFFFTDSEGKEISIDSSEVVLYLLDLDMVKRLPLAYQDFTQSFKLPGILPGGSHCMMNAVNINGRPFMGPNIYMTPSSSFTHFHQDGHGTVDSGHYCHRGFNEVIMLRRLPERHKHHALHLLNGTSLSSDSFLYGKPHDQEVQSGWPTNDAIERCRKMRYYPSVFILKPGQLVHINKGRLHAFRKLSPSHLQESDCHYNLREEILPSIGPEEFTCVSVAWDWMFKGVTSEGINREVASILECSRLNQKHSVQSLAIPETALLFLAKEHVVRLLIQNSGKASGFMPDSKTILRGILPSLQFVVHRHSMTENASISWMAGGRHEKVSIDPKPNAWQNPDSFSLDPFGCGDFICKFCHEELSNVYMHCDGCERLLNKDFNICTSCHSELKYKANIQMHPFNPKKKSTLNHMGSVNFKRQSRCPCKNGPACDTCSYCIGCSCTCHQQFTLHYRFMPVQKELDLLQKVEEAVGTEVLPSSLETKVRLCSLLSGDFKVPSEAFSNDGVHVNSSQIRSTSTIDVVNRSQIDVYEDNPASKVQPPRQEKSCTGDDEGNVDAKTCSQELATEKVYATTQIRLRGPDGKRKLEKKAQKEVDQNARGLEVYPNPLQHADSTSAKIAAITTYDSIKPAASTRRRPGNWTATQKLSVISQIEAELEALHAPRLTDILPKYGLSLTSYSEWTVPSMMETLTEIARKEGGRKSKRTRSSARNLSILSGISDETNPHRLDSLSSKYGIYEEDAKSTAAKDQPSKAGLAVDANDESDEEGLQDSISGEGRADTILQDRLSVLLSVEATPVKVSSIHDGKSRSDEKNGIEGVPLSNGFRDGGATTNITEESNPNSSLDTTSSKVRHANPSEVDTGKDSGPTIDNFNNGIEGVPVSNSLHNDRSEMEVQDDVKANTAKNHNGMAKPNPADSCFDTATSSANYANPLEVDEPPASVFSVQPAETTSKRRSARAEEGIATVVGDGENQDSTSLVNEDFETNVKLGNLEENANPSIAREKVTAGTVAATKAPRFPFKDWTDSQKLSVVLKIEAEFNVPNPPKLDTLIAKHGISNGSFYRWKKLKDEQNSDAAVQNDTSATATVDSAPYKSRRSASQKLAIISGIETELDGPHPPELESLLAKHKVSRRSFDEWRAPDMKAKLQQRAFIEEAYDSGVGSESSSSNKRNDVTCGPNALQNGHGQFGANRRGYRTAVEKLLVLSQIEAELKAPDHLGLNDLLSKYGVSRTSYTEWRLPSNRQELMEEAMSEEGHSNGGVPEPKVNSAKASTKSAKVAARRVHIRSASQKLAIISGIETELRGTNPPKLKSLLAKYGVARSSFEEWRTSDKKKKLKEMASKEEAFDSGAGSDDDITDAVHDSDRPARIEGRSSPKTEDENDDDSDSDPITKDVLDALGPGSRVIIYHQAKYWNATVIKRGEKKRKGQFRIHYDGQKRSMNDWVAEDKVASLLRDEKQS